MTAAHPGSPRLSNVALGRLIGLDHTSVSRLRRGERGCSTAVMVRIEDLFGWPVRDQFAALADGTFGPELDRRSAEYCATTTRQADHDTPADS